MTHLEIREKFLSFFAHERHKALPSSSLLPDNDPTVLLTTAGMQQFKGYFLSECDPETEIGSRRVATIQKCFRTTDIDCVGDETHLTFFEMLGNFSFGDYFKAEAIDYAWRLLVDVFGLQGERLYATVFAGDGDIPQDSEAREHWLKYLPPARIKDFGREANFWGPPGTVGPCGPSSEIHYDLSMEPCTRPDCGPNCPCGRFVEIWNLVFMQYFKNEAGAHESLQRPSIDTGAGLERLVTILQKKNNVFETDLLNPLIFEIITRKNVIKDSDWRAIRILADHVRGSVFLIADGVQPLNLTQGYILRRIMRRAIRYAKELEIDRQFYITLIDKVLEIFGSVYPELIGKKTEILDVWQKEEEKFRRTLDKGLKEFSRLVSGLQSRNETELGGERVFHLYDTYGFPVELSEELAREAGISIDRAGFDQEFHRHQMVSKAGVQGKFGGHGLILSGELKAGTEEEVKIVTRLHTATHLLHAALRLVLGGHVRQMGSDITPERLRFDFTHQAKLTPEEIQNIETVVNEEIRRGLGQMVQQMPYEEAIKSGALAFFSEKYPKIVNVYSFGDNSTSRGQIFSREVCGGPHVLNTREIGQFKIIKEEAVGAGVRRIRAMVV